jgi:peptidoglycan/LPS O-acetylase OafA/YrhL
MTAPSATLPRYETLDHWRGVAALAVVVFHACQPWYEMRAPPGFGWLAAIAEQGFRGVHLFFVISGYCIAHLVVREYRGRRDLPGFLLQRFLRIFPPYWGACLAAAIIALVSVPFNHGAIFASPTGPGALPASLGSWLSHALLIDAWRDRGGYLLVAWTLSWELSYYFLAALALGLGLRFGRTTGLAFALTLAVAGTIPAVAAVLPPLAGWTEFMCGTCVFLAVDAHLRGHPSSPWLIPLLLFGAAGVLLGGPTGNLTVSAAFALALFGLHRYDLRLGAVRSIAWLGRLGAMSYSLYLIHVPVASPINNLLARFIPAPSQIYLFSILLAIVASLVAAALFFAYLETPVESWRRSRHLRASPVSPKFPQ